MLIHNLIVEYGVYLSILLVLENILMFALFFYSVWFFIRIRKTNLNRENATIEMYRSLNEKINSFKGDCKE